MAEELTKESFEGHGGSVFTAFRSGSPGEVNQDIDPVDLQLTKVTDHSRESLDSFSCLFHGPKAKLLEQGTYKLKHDKLGELELFLVPVVNPDPDDDRICYEAVFSRLKE